MFVPTTKVSCQLDFQRFVSCQLKFWPFVSCQLTIFRPSYNWGGGGGGGVEKSTAIGEGARGTLSCHLRHIFIVFLFFFFRLKHAMTQNFSQGLFNEQGSWEQGWLSHLFSKVTME